MFAFNALNYELLIKDRISISNGVAFSFFSSSPEWYLGPWNITYYWLRCTNDKVTWDSDVRETLLSSLQNIKIKGVKLNIQLLIWPSLLKKGNWTFFFSLKSLYLRLVAYDLQPTQTVKNLKMLKTMTFYAYLTSEKITDICFTRDILLRVPGELAGSMIRHFI